MNPTARSFQPSKSHATSSPPSSQFNPRNTSFAPAVPLSKTTPGWPPEQSPLTDKRWNDTHPSEIPDTVFLSDHASWLHLENPFEGNYFEPSLIPWWTHWVVVFANKKTNLDDSAIAKLYKHRYRDVIPGIQNMVTADALQLYEYLCDSAHTYASEWDQRSEPYLRETVLVYLREAETYMQEARRKNRGQSSGARAGRLSTSSLHGR